MKNLDTVQKLWSHFLMCPTCKDFDREVDVSVGPDTNTRLVLFKKENHILTLDIVFKAKKQQYKIQYNINCLDNSFKVDIAEILDFSAVEDKYKRTDRASAPYFYFYLFGTCRKCGNSFSNSKEMELDLLNNKITNIGLEHESIYILKNGEGFHLNLDYEKHNMSVAKFTIDTTPDDIVNNEMELPLIEMDFSNTEKVFDKIKTLLIFS
jgi:hypothetical protein